jgi:predicted DNA-binding transcriptional regulator AlpA
MIDQLKALALLASLERAAQTARPTTPGVLDPLFVWSQENGEAFSQVVFALRTGEPAYAMVQLFAMHKEAVRRQSPSSVDSIDYASECRRIFIGVAQTLRDDLLQLRSSGLRRAGSDSEHQQPAEFPPLLSLKQVAEWTDNAPNSIDAWERKGEFPPRRTLPAVRGSGPGKRVFIKTEVTAWIEGGDWRKLVSERQAVGNG